MGDFLLCPNKLSLGEALDFAVLPNMLSSWLCVGCLEDLGESYEVAPRTGGGLSFLCLVELPALDFNHLLASPGRNVSPSPGWVLRLAEEGRSGLWVCPIRNFCRWPEKMFKIIKI